MGVESPEKPIVVAAHQDEPDAGVIKDARARQRRHRALGGAVVVALLAGAVGFAFAGNTTTPQSLPSWSPTWLHGAPLSGATHLRLVASQNGGTVYVVDVDRHRARAVPGLMFPPQAPPAVQLSAVPGGALAVVSSRSCWQGCALRQTLTDFLIGANGAARPTAQVILTRHQYTSQAFDSTDTWVLTWPRSGGCTLRLVPGVRAAVAVPCGALGADTAAGLWLSRGDQQTLIDPQTGRVRARLAVHGQFDVVRSDMVLTSTTPGIPGEGDAFPTDLMLVNLSTGARKRLAWPSILHFGYTVLVEPNGQLVAVEFYGPSSPDPTTPGWIGEASDVWLLDTRIGAFTHVPGFPILEHIKFSHIAWTNDHRLVVVAQGGGRTAVGVWRPGSHQLQVGTVPQLAGYLQFVPLLG